ncbi:hypothetical protein VB773_19665 [Haloarculaceae archaeon H-GB2-1]|nr:hypothetical protein [Haloarculaceae archaeon H-GB1-1]MEA5409576.1 hypothetical protein [Haloarculaceae archaeon H-GB2-1]
MAQRSATRRKFLAGVLGGAGSLAGCVGRGSQASDTGSQKTEQGAFETSTPSVFTDLHFDGAALVVTLREEHTVERVNLIDPEGRLFRQADLSAGVTTVQLPVLDIEPGLGGYEHYIPGTHEVIAVAGEERYSTTVELQPALQVTDVAQYRDGDSPTDYGKLVVTVANTGSAPTWVYDVAYAGSPNFAANEKVSDGPGVPLLEYPTKERELLIASGEKQRYVGSSAPVLLSSDESSGCEGETYEFTVSVGTAIGDVLTSSVQVTVGGELESAGMGGAHTCSNLSVSNQSE